MSWRWVVEPGVEAAPDALEELHRARAMRPDATLLASRVVLPDGGLDPASEPMPRILDKAETIEAARDGLLAVRAVRPGSLLVREDLAARLERSSRGQVLAQTAAALTAGRGYLAPRSVAVRREPVPAESRRARLRLVTAPFWTREERLLQLFALAGGGRRRAVRAGR